MKLGILSGTFDPIHNGHIALAQAAIETGDIDRVAFIVEQTPRRKQPVVTLEQRTEMVRAALRNNSFFEVLNPSDQVVHTPKATLKFLQNAYGSNHEFALIMGGDVFACIERWDDYDFLLANYSFIVGLRTEDDGEEAVEIKQRTGANVRLAQVGLPAVSSTAIRESTAAGETPSNVAPSVAKYINQHGLYASKN